MTREDVMKTRVLAKISSVILVFTLWSPLMNSSTKPSKDNATVGEQQLNIIFHGLFSYIIWSDHLEVLAPQVDEHVYKAGTWGQEMRLKESVMYRLTGVHG